MRFKVHDYSVLGSTNDEAKYLLTQGFPEGTVVRAEMQTAGRGRRGRTWSSEPGNLLISLILKPQCSVSQVSQLSFIIAVSVGQALLPLLNRPEILSYKWPNDVLLEGKKVAGILIETESQGDSFIEGCIVGIGINLIKAPSVQKYPTAALQSYVKEYLTSDEILKKLLDQIEIAYGTWQREGFGPIRSYWLERAHKLGEYLTILVGDKEYEGQFLDISPEGSMLLKSSDGNVHHLVTAEIL